MYEELEKLRIKYPIGTKLNKKEYIEWHNKVYYTEKDLIEYRRRYGEVEILDDTYCRIKDKKVNYDMVDGYLYDGNNWIIVKNYCGEWLPISVEEEDGSE